MDAEFNEQVALERREPLHQRLNRLEERLRRDTSDSRDYWLAVFLSVRRDVEDASRILRDG